MTEHVTMLPGDEVASFLIAERGYIVLGLLIPTAQAGDALMTFAGMNLSQPVVLTEPTDRNDWLAQSKLAAPRFKPRADIPRSSLAEQSKVEAWFWRAITD